MYVKIDTTKELLIFPLLMRDISEFENESIILLFVNKNDAIVLFSNNANYNEYEELKGVRFEDYKEFKGDITFSNYKIK